MRRASTLALVGFGVLLASASAARPILNCCALIEEPIISCQREGLQLPKHGGNSLLSNSSEKCTFKGLGISYYHNLTKAEAKNEFKCSTIHLWDTVLSEEKHPDKYNGFTGFAKYLNDFDCKNETCTCNIGIGGFTRNPGREIYVQSLPPFVLDSLSVIQNVMDFQSKPDFWFFFTPFDRRVWLGIFSLIVGVIVVMLLDHDYDPPNNAATASQKDPTPAVTREFTFSARVKSFLVHNPVLRRIRLAVLSVSFAFAGHIFDAPSNQQRRLPTGRQRLLLLVALLFGTFLVLGYEASLVLNIFFADSSNNYRGVEDIFNCKIADSDICIPGDGNTQSFWDEVATPLRKVSGCRSEARVIREPCPEDTKQKKPFDKVEYGLGSVKRYNGTKSECTCRYFLGPTTATAFLIETTEFCSKVTSVGKPFYPNELGFVLPRDSEWTAVLSKATLKASSDLSIIGPIEYGRSKNGTNLTACNFNDESLLRFSALRGFFIVAWSFLSAVWLFMCISIVTRLVSEKCGPTAEAIAP